MQCAGFMLSPMIILLQQRYGETLFTTQTCLQIITEKNVTTIFLNFSEQCLIEPQRAQYEGGIIANPDFTHGVQGWTVFGQGAIKEGISKNGNRYIVAHSRSQPLDSISQKVQLEKGKLYSFSGMTFPILLK
jgi:hypothetical protein